MLFIAGLCLGFCVGDFICYWTSGYSAIPPFFLVMAFCLGGGWLWAIMFSLGGLRYKNKEEDGRVQ